MPIEKKGIWGFDYMFAKMLLAWAVVVMCLTVHGQAQYDPLASDLFTLPDDLRKTSNLDTQRVYINPNADPLSIDPLMRPLDPEHTTEYLSIISGRQLGPFVPVQEDLRGIWNLDMQGGRPAKIELLLVQNRDAVFGRGAMTVGSSNFAISASGWAVKDVLYFDMVSPEDLTLYRCTLTMSKDFLSGSFNAYDAQGQAWSGTIQGARST